MASKAPRVAAAAPAHGSGGDRELLAMRAPLEAAVAAIGASDMSDDWDEEGLTRTADALKRICQAIVDAAPASTPAGLALKAAAVMHQLSFSYCGGWPGLGEEMAWQLLAGLAGGLYVPPAVPGYMRAALS